MKKCELPTAVRAFGTALLISLTMLPFAAPADAARFPQTPSNAAVRQAPLPKSPGAPAMRPIESQQEVTAYTLPPDLYQKAKTLSNTHFALNLIDFFYGIFVLWLVLHLQLAPKFRDWAERAAPNRFLQAFVFTPALILTIAALESPTAIYEHIISRRYGLSVEGWGALAWDWTKAILLLMVIGGILAWILYAVIRRSPRRWWFYFWLISVPIIVFLSFVEPFVVEPMFFTFAPLPQKDPALR